jgi:hypothetical protein
MITPPDGLASEMQGGRSGCGARLGPVGGTGAGSWGARGGA